MNGSATHPVPGSYICMCVCPFIFMQQQIFFFFLESGRTGSSACLKDETKEFFRAHVPYWEGTTVF